MASGQQHYTLHINSIDATGTSNNDFALELSELNINSTMDGYYIALKYITFLNANPTVHQYNQNIIFSEDGGLTTLTAVIPEGFYDSTTILTAIGVAMTAAGGQNYNATLDATSQKVSITSDIANFLILEGDLTAYEILGFTSTGSSTGLTYTGEGILDLSGSKTLMIEITPLDHHGLNTRVNTAFLAAPLTASYGYVETYIPQQLSYKHIKSRNMTNFNVRLLGDDRYPFVLPSNVRVAIEFDLIPIYH